ncbi:phage tail tube assembly chaperone [Liquorilactobacillus hordei]|uniref:phage tail tube assembly chaperone n=1 Tax=Liquorilactobacillus hordei TaxID=468911 RepID=UPI0039E7A7B6
MEQYIKQFNKRFRFKASNKNMRATVKLQLMLAKAEDMGNKEPKEQLEDFLNMTSTVEDYINNLLKLNKEQYEKLEDLEFNETVEIANLIASKIMGISNDEVEKAKKSPKK